MRQQLFVSAADTDKKLLLSAATKSNKVGSCLPSRCTFVQSAHPAWLSAHQPSAVLLLPAPAQGYSAAYATKKIARAKAKEAKAELRAKMKVADAVEDAMRHKMKYGDNPKKMAKYMAKDAADIAEAIADAKAIKVKAKMKTMKVVAKVSVCL